MKTLMDEDSEKAIDTINEFISNTLNDDENKPKYGYMFMTFGFTEDSPPNLTYVSNAKDSSMVALLKYLVEFIEKEKLEKK